MTNRQSLPHHDGSPLYLNASTLALGGNLTVRLRVPSTWPTVESVWLRTTPNAEPSAPIAAVIAAQTAGDTWWEAVLPIANPVVRYRFFVQGVRDVWVNSAGVWECDVPDAADYAFTTFSRPPSWLSDTVGYQIFPDRFARSEARYDVPEWAVPAEWDDPIHPDSSVGVLQYYGGDLPGVEAHLDHLTSLGANLLYLTPVFPAGSHTGTTPPRSTRSIRCLAATTPTPRSSQRLTIEVSEL